jgi:hypothetical protein
MTTPTIKDLKAHINKEGRVVAVLRAEKLVIVKFTNGEVIGC